MALEESWKPLVKSKMSPSGAVPKPPNDANSDDGEQPASETARRYPDYLMDFPPDVSAEQVERWQRFFDLREDILLDYSYQTARAYWADLQDIFEWAVARDKDVLALTERDLTQYRALLRRRKYSESTIRRRMVTWRKMEERMKE